MLKQTNTSTGKMFLSQPADYTHTLNKERRSIGASLAREVLGTPTPQRKALLLSPSALVQVGGSPNSKRYTAMNNVGLGTKSPQASRKCVKRLSFAK